MFWKDVHNSNCPWEIKEVGIGTGSKVKASGAPRNHQRK